MMRISRKIALLIGVAMLTCGAISGFGWYGLKRVEANMAEVAGNSVPALLLVSDMRSSYLASIPMVYDRAVTTDSDKGVALEKQIAQVQQALLKRVSEYADRPTTEEEKKVVVEAKLGLAAFIFKINKLNIVKIDGLDASGHSAAAVHNRPDVAGRMKAAHVLFDAAVASTQRAGAAVDAAMDEIDASNQRIDGAGRMRQAHQSVRELKGLVPAGATPVPVEAMKIGGRMRLEHAGLADQLAKIPDVGRDEDFER